MLVCPKCQKLLKKVNNSYLCLNNHCYDISKVFYSMGGGLRQSLDYWEFIRMPVLHPTDREQEEIISYIKNICKRDPRTGKVVTGGIVSCKDSRWLLSWTINRQGQFKEQKK